MRNVKRHNDTANGSAVRRPGAPPRATALAALLCAGALALAGCGSGTSSSDDSAAAGSDAVPTVAALDSVKEDTALSARLPDKIKKRGTLIIGSDTTFPPGEFLAGDDGQTPVGYDVDNAKALAAKLGLKLDFQSSAFDAILPAIGTKYDLGYSSFYVTKKRLKAVNFVSDSQGGSTLLVQKGNPQNLNLKNLCGHTIAAQTGSTQLDDTETMSKACTKAGEKPLNVLPMQQNTDAVTRLTAGSVDGVLSAASTLGYAATQSHGQVELIDEQYAAGIDGIAVAKNDPEFAKLIADTFNSIIKDGTYAKVMKAWGQEDQMIKKSEVNPKTDM